MMRKRLAYILVAISLAVGLVACGAPTKTPIEEGSVSDTTPPTTPTNITETELGITCIVLLPTPYDRWRYQDSTGEIRLRPEITELRFTWDAASDDSLGVASYQVSLDSATFTDIGNATSYSVPCRPGRPPDGSHTFKVRAVDKVGNEGVPGSLTFTINIAPPVIEEVGISNISETGAIITWTTNEPIYGSVAYWWWDSIPWNRSAYAFVDSPQLSTKHTITLAGLEEGTTYHFEVKSIDEAENRAFSTVFFFTTLEK